MVSRLISLGNAGLKVYKVESEVDVQRGLPCVSLVGLADTAVKESKDRVRSAIKNSGFDFPRHRITVNLAPADIKKEGTHFDLPIALGIIFSSLKKNIDFSPYIIAGELSLEGDVRKIRGVFPMALEAREMKKKMIVPFENAREASLVDGLEVYPVKKLSEAVSFLEGYGRLDCYRGRLENFFQEVIYYDVDFSEVKGQYFARRAVEVAVAGMHNLIMIGPPGVGKTMIAKRIPTVLPDMELEEMLEVTKIHSINGNLDSRRPILKQRPYRAPHHTASSVALAGGGTDIKPGEITLAHKGVLFLDELPEFNRSCLEVLRQPLEDGCVYISRAGKHLRFPSEFLFIAAMNPCPCGYFGSRSRNCNCSTYRIQKYRNKISGPLLDRIDIHVEMPEIKTKDLMSSEEKPESSSSIKKRVESARKTQKERFREYGIFFNSQMKQRHIPKFCILDKDAGKVLEMAIKHFNLSARAYDKILKVSRTIADLAGRQTITPEDISEAVQYRSLDKNLWI